MCRDNEEIKSSTLNKKSVHYHKKTRTRTEGIIARVSREFPSYFSLLPKKKEKEKRKKRTADIVQSVIADFTKHLTKTEGKRDRDGEKERKKKTDGTGEEKERKRERGSNADRLSVPRHRYLPLLLSPLSLPAFPLEEVPTIPSKTPGESRGLV